MQQNHQRGKSVGSGGDRKWLREASMKRLSLFVKNKTELIGSANELVVGRTSHASSAKAQKTGSASTSTSQAYGGVEASIAAAALVNHGSVSPDSIESSGLNDYDAQLLSQWVNGTITGRQCLLALRERRGGAFASTSTSSAATAGGETGGVSLVPADMVRSLLDLPHDFLCDSGPLYSQLFSKPPSSVLREALALVARKALERGPAALGAEQINIAIKQLRLEALSSSSSRSSFTATSHRGGEGDDDDGQDAAAGGGDRGDEGRVQEEQSDRKFRLQVMVEVIRLHLASTAAAAREAQQQTQPTAAGGSHHRLEKKAQGANRSRFDRDSLDPADLSLPNSTTMSSPFHMAKATPTSRVRRGNWRGRGLKHSSNKDEDDDDDGDIYDFGAWGNSGNRSPEDEANTSSSSSSSSSTSSYRSSSSSDSDLGGQAEGTGAGAGGRANTEGSDSDVADDDSLEALLNEYLPASYLRAHRERSDAPGGAAGTGRPEKPSSSSHRHRSSSKDHHRHHHRTHGRHRHRRSASWEQESNNQEGSAGQSQAGATTKQDKRLQEQDQKEAAAAEAEAEAARRLLRKTSLDSSALESHLRTPLPAVLAAAKQLPGEVLEHTNGLLKPYLQRLAALKSNLGAQLKELQDQRAYLALGVVRGASDEALKKAYRALAVKLHPDKPGGDTARFQQLQDAYQEVMKRRKADQAQREARDEVRQGRQRRQREQRENQAEQHKGGEEVGTRSAPETKAEYGGEGGEEDDEDDAEDGSDHGNEKQEEESDIDLEDGGDEEDDVLSTWKKTRAKFDQVKKKKKAAGSEDGNGEDEEGEEEEGEEDRKATVDKDDLNQDGDDEQDAHLEEEEEEEDLEGASSEFAAFKERLRRNSSSEKKNSNADAGNSGEEEDDDHEGVQAEDVDEDDADGDADGDDDGDDEFSAFFGGRTGAGAGMSRSKSQRHAEAHAYESEEAHAAAVEEQVGRLMCGIQECAARCTRLAQLNIKWQKAVDKASLLGHPQALREVNKVISASTGNRSLLKLDKKHIPATTTAGTAAAVQSNMEVCALHNAVEPVEQLCEQAQSVAALAMELPNECGARFAAAAASNKAFLQAVEHCMQLSLGALKTVLSLIHSQEQLAGSVRRVRESAALAEESSEVHALLLEMARTAVKSNVITISAAVDRVVEAALAAADVQEQVQQIRRSVAAQLEAEARRRAATYEHEEAEDDLCEEDRAALRKARADMMRGGGGSSGAAGAGRQQQETKSGGEGDAGAGEGQQGNEEEGGGGGGDDDGLDAGMKGLNDLKDKIRMLQVQLKVQHVQALQTMNAEVVGLQQQILGELMQLPFVSDAPSLFSADVTARMTQAMKAAEPLQQQQQQHGSGGEETSVSPPPASASAPKVSAPHDYRTSVLSLLAECVDSSCLALRNALANPCLSSPPAISTASGSSASVRPLLVAEHLGWLRLVLADGSDSLPLLQHSLAAAGLSFPTSSSTSTSTTPSTATQEKGEEYQTGKGSKEEEEEKKKEGVEQERSVRVALLPDYRSKALFLASLVDAPAVRSILGAELKQRLLEMFPESPDAPPATEAAPTNGHAASEGNNGGAVGAPAALKYGPASGEQLGSNIPPPLSSKPTTATNATPVRATGTGTGSGAAGADYSPSCASVDSLDLPPSPPTPPSSITTPAPPLPPSSDDIAPVSCDTLEVTATAAAVAAGCGGSGGAESDDDNNSLRAADSVGPGNVGGEAEFADIDD